jgi:hypothetical protein
LVQLGQHGWFHSVLIRMKTDKPRGRHAGATGEAGR